MVEPLYSKTDIARAVEVKNRKNGGVKNARSPFRRDYGRLLHSPAFRRLQGKTQLFPGTESDFFRNRLTHSLEVAQIAKSIALSINKNTSYLKEHPIDLDLIELTALLHDLGHPPFGHNGEKALDHCMKEYGGFEGNAQTLRIITRLEKKDFNESSSALSGFDEQNNDQRVGLNLTFRSVASVLKYDNEIPEKRSQEEKLVKGYYASDSKIVGQAKTAVAPKYPVSKSFKTLECYIMDIADDIAYSTYDLEDSLKAGFLTPLDILASPEAVTEKVANEVEKSIGKKFTQNDVMFILIEIMSRIFTDSERPYEFETTDNFLDLLLHTINIHKMSNNLSRIGSLRTDFTSHLIHDFVSNVEFELNDSFPALSKAYLKTEALKKVEVLKHYTYVATIMSPRLKVAEHRGYEIVKGIFEALKKNGEDLLPDDFSDVYSKQSCDAGKARVICDFIAGMTDRYAIEFYNRLYGAYNVQTIFKPL